MIHDPHLAQPLLIRTARITDAVTLYRACFAEQPFEHIFDYLEWCLAEPARPTRLIAFDGEQVVGHVEVTLRPYATRWAEISSLVVTERRRGEGFGRRLVGAARRLARRWECTEVRLQVTARDQTLLSRYRRWDFTTRGLPINGYLWMSYAITPADTTEPHRLLLPDTLNSST